MLVLKTFLILFSSLSQAEVVSTGTGSVYGTGSRKNISACQMDLAQELKKAKRKFEAYKDLHRKIQNEFSGKYSEIRDIYKALNFKRRESGERSTAQFIVKLAKRGHSQENIRKARSNLDQFEEQATEYQNYLETYKTKGESKKIDLLEDFSKKRQVVQALMAKWSDAALECDQKGELSKINVEVLKRMMKYSFDIIKEFTEIEKEYYLNNIHPGHYAFSHAYHVKALEGVSKFIPHLGGKALPYVEQIGLLDFVVREQKDLLGNWERTHLFDFQNEDPKYRKEFKENVSRLDPFYYYSGNGALLDVFSGLSKVEGKEAKKAIAESFRQRGVVPILFKRLTTHTIDLSGYGTAGSSQYVHFGPTFTDLFTGLPELKDELGKKQFSAPYPKEANMPKNFSIKDFFKFQFNKPDSYWHITNGGQKSGAYNSLEELNKIFK